MRNRIIVDIWHKIDTIVLLIFNLVEVSHQMRCRSVYYILFLLIEVQSREFI